MSLMKSAGRAQFKPVRPDDGHEMRGHIACVHCGHLDSRVLNSRGCRQKDGIRRQRECQGCHGRFTTYETLVPMPAVQSRIESTLKQLEKIRAMADDQIATLLALQQPETNNAENSNVL
ncbi:MAG: hypothetical protein ABI977_16545 [Acidobacteriota bacterium]